MHIFMYVKIFFTEIICSKRNFLTLQKSLGHFSWELQFLNILFRYIYESLGYKVPESNTLTKFEMNIS